MVALSKEIHVNSCNESKNMSYIPRRFKQMAIKSLRKESNMKDEIIAAISSKLKEIYPDGTIYLDSVMQSTKDFYFVLSVMESGTENVGIDIQNVS